jgi:hypothetical protein
VFGQSASGNGVNGTSSTGTGVRGINNSPSGSSGTGVSGSGYAYGVQGTSSGPAGTGVFGQGSGFGVYGSSSDPGFAGYFLGKVGISGTITKGGGTFKIDHPQDPENKYLSHSFVESPDMMNVYNGNIVLDGNGAAVVELPSYFESLNRDFRYQLTCIGEPAVLYIAEKVSGNHFKIAGGKAGMEVSWQVTGIRQDAFANAHPIVVEQDKSANEKGLYLHPTEWGQPKEKGINQALNK